MATESQPRRWTAGSCEAGGFTAWFLLVLRDQYGVRWLQPDDLALDALFLAAVLGALAARFAARRGLAALSRVASRVAVAGVATAAAIVGGEYAARFAFRNERSSGNAADYNSQPGGGPCSV